MEKAILFLDDLTITQKANSSFSHKGDLAIDIVGKGSLKAPFTGIIKRVYSNVNAVWIESIEKVKYSDGTEDYMTIMTLHDNDVSNLYEGQLIKQGIIYYDMGTKGYTTGSHIHLSVGKGKYTGNGWYKNEYNNWCINNQYPCEKALFVFDENRIINDGGYEWIKTGIINEKVNNYYIVKKGDTLTKIANKYNTTIKILKELNKIKNVNLIYINQKLLLPSVNIYYKKYEGNSVSIVDSLKSIGVDSSYNNRIKIATNNGIENYKGTKTQNLYLLDLLKQGKLKM